MKAYRNKGATRCLQCGMAILTDAESYQQHKDKFHSIAPVEKIRPVNTSGRSKKEIVAAVEKTLKEFLIFPPEVIVPVAVPAAVELVHAGYVVPAQYCGINGASCVWESNGWEICGPCKVRKEWEASQNAAV
jgi:hypothetical protein